MICRRPIMPGDEYEADVDVAEKHFTITKVHTFCPEDFFREEAEEVARADAWYESQQAANESSAAA